METPNIKRPANLNAIPAAIRRTRSENVSRRSRIPSANRLLLVSMIAIASMRPADGLAQAVGEPAPDFSAKSTDGAVHTLSDLKGKVVLLDFWASWCGPCRQELPFLSELYKARHDTSLVILAVNVDTEAKARDAFVRSIRPRLPFPVIADAKGEIPGKYEIPGMPTVVFIDRAGKVRYVHSGFRVSFEKTYREELAELMEESE